MSTKAATTRASTAKKYWQTLVKVLNPVSSKKAAHKFTETLLAPDADAGAGVSSADSTADGNDIKIVLGKVLFAKTLDMLARSDTEDHQDGSFFKTTMCLLRATMGAVGFESRDDGRRNTGLGPRVPLEPSLVSRALLAACWHFCSTTAATVVTEFDEEYGDKDSRSAFVPCVVGSTLMDASDFLADVEGVLPGITRATTRLLSACLDEDVERTRVNIVRTIKMFAMWFLAPVVRACGAKGRHAVMDAVVAFVQTWVDDAVVPAPNPCQLPATGSHTPHLRRALCASVSALAVLKACGCMNDAVTAVSALGITDSAAPGSVVAALVWGNVLLRTLTCDAERAKTMANTEVANIVQYLMLASSLAVPALYLPSDKEVSFAYDHYTEGRCRGGVVTQDLDGKVGKLVEGTAGCVYRLLTAGGDLALLIHSLVDATGFAGVLITALPCVLSWDTDWTLPLLLQVVPRGMAHDVAAGTFKQVLEDMRRAFEAREMIRAMNEKRTVKLPLSTWDPAVVTAQVDELRGRMVGCAPGPGGSNGCSVKRKCVCRFL